MISKKDFLDYKDPHFQKILKIIQSHCYTYVKDCLHDICGGSCRNGKNTFIQKWDIKGCNTEIDSVWVQVYSKNRHAYFAHEDCFRREHLSFNELNFLTDEYTKTKYISLKECGEAVLESI